MADAVATAASTVQRMPAERVFLLVTALAGSLLVSLSGQFVSFNIADIAGRIGATADEASWLATTYTMGLFVGIVAASPLIATFGLRRYMAVSAMAFAILALVSAAEPPLHWFVALRGLQGVAAGGFGPMAFVATFMTTAGPRLPFGLALLALILLLPASFGPVVSSLIEDRLGWEALFHVQAGIGAGLAMLAILVMPRGPVSWAALRRDWTALLLLSLALAATLLVLGQGTRRYWLDSPTIAWSLAIAVGAWAGFLLTVWRSPLPVLSLELLGRRSFAVPITLNLMFRIGFAITAFLVPQFLVLAHGYRPLQIGQLYGWIALSQLLAFPLAWWLMQRIERRLIIAAGLALFGLGALLAGGSTGLSAGVDFKTTMMLAGVGQVLFLVPNLVAGGSQLKPADGPTASLLFNATTLGGTNIGVALATELVAERQKFHHGAIAESAAAYAPASERLDALSATFGLRLGEDALGAARTFATAAAALRREAWVLSFKDAFLLAAGLLLASAVAVLLLHPQPPLRGSNIHERGRS